MTDADLLAQPQPSDAIWCGRFPTSTSLNDLDPSFEPKVVAFISALKDAGASVHVSATYRPKERAYLMHYCCLIADGKIAPHDVPSMDGVNIDWVAGGKSGASEMVQGYDIAYPAALQSRHTQRLAVDMTISWAGSIEMWDARGVSHICQAQEDLWPIGASYGVIKLPSDSPHWSSDGR